MSILIIISILTIILSLGIGIMCYIFEGFGLMEMAKKKGEKNSWLSWVPYAKEFLRGKIAYGTNKGGVVYLCVNIAIIVIYFLIYFLYVFLQLYMSINQNLTMDVYTTTQNVQAVGTSQMLIPLIMSIISLLVFISILVYYYIVTYKIYKQFSDKAVVMLVVTIFVPVMEPIFYFAIRKNDLRVLNKMKTE